MILQFLNVGLLHYLLLGLILFCIGLLGVIISRNIIKMLFSLEILLCAVNVNMIAFTNYCDLSNVQGHIFTLFIIAISACETAIGLAMLISLYRNKPTVDVEEIKELKG